MKHIVFQEYSIGQIFVNNTKGFDLGYIEYNKKWKCYVYCPSDDIQLSASCQEEIFNKLVELDKVKKP